MERKSYKTKYIFKITIVLAIVIFLVSIAEQVSAGAEINKGLDTAANQGYGSIEEGSGVVTSIPGAIGKIIGIALSFIGLAFFVLMVYGGFIWMFARGNDQDVQKAKDLIQSAVIGLIIVMSAYAITMFIGNALTKGV